MPRNRFPAKPFVKWAGGKSQLLSQLDRLLPKEVVKGELRNYYEPFLGGGAMFFHISNNYDLEHFVLCDVNQDLILAYDSVKCDLKNLVAALADLSYDYSGRDAADRSDMFYEIREEFNDTDYEEAVRAGEGTIRAAQFIFLNKTCFNGLHRVNKSGKFNVPFGRYVNPQILDKDNLVAVSSVLQNAELRIESYEALQCNIEKKSFVYYDPPYRPVSKTSSFTSYSCNGFQDTDQIKLSKVFKSNDRDDIYQMLSNSDAGDDFFENLYEGFQIAKVDAKRFINCDATGRGSIAEIVVCNYEAMEERNEIPLFLSRPDSVQR